jgi:lysyl-tRNA synthetase class I
MRLIIKIIIMPICLKCGIRLKEDIEGLQVNGGTVYYNCEDTIQCKARQWN